MVNSQKAQSASDLPPSQQRVAGDGGLVATSGGSYQEPRSLTRSGLARQNFCKHKLVKRYWK